jgi:formylglycine-generating enzyme required for sulfatase activity
MVYIPDGEFEMGDHHGDGLSLDELPLHAVLLDAFFMGRYEISNQQYCDYLNSALGSSIYVSDGIVYGSGNNQPYCDTHSYDANSQIDYSAGVFSVKEKGVRDMSHDPMVQVSWYGSAAYCNWRSSEKGKESCYNLSTWECDYSKHGYRLATEAEWEYAARGGKAYYRFPWGDTISHSQANYYADPCMYSYDVNPTKGYHLEWNGNVPHTSQVGSFVANGFRLYDMAGNVWEWCNDWYDSDYYDTSPYDNPTGPASGTGRVLRGGSWYYFAILCRSASRFYVNPGSRYGYFGFRIVLDLD